MTKVNPYAAPQSDVEGGGTDEVRRIRQEHLRHEGSIQGIGALWILGGVIMCLAGGLILVTLPLAFMSGEDVPKPIAVLVLIPIYLGLGVLSVVTGRWMRQIDPRAVNPATILAVLGLLGFPIGTLISVYILYLLHSARGRMIFSERYAEIRAQTPDMRYRTSAVAWIVLGVLVVGFFGLMFWALG